MLPKRTPPQSLLSRALLASASTKQHHQIRQKATQQTSYIVPNTPKTDFPAPVQQSPNRAEPWSRTQARKSQVAVGPRFEQIDWSLQPNPLSAQELIAKVPVIKVKARRVACNGDAGGTPGHPTVYINLDGTEPESCGYCGLRFQQEHEHH